MGREIFGVGDLSVFKHSVLETKTVQTHTRRYPLLRRGESGGRGKQEGERAGRMNVVAASVGHLRLGERGTNHQAITLIIHSDPPTRESPGGVQISGLAALPSPISVRPLQMHFIPRLGATSSEIH